MPDEPLQWCHRPHLPTDQAHYTAVCPNCRSGFEFIRSEATAFKHKTKGECYRLICPCCGLPLAVETLTTKGKT